MRLDAVHPVRQPVRSSAAYFALAFPLRRHRLGVDRGFLKIVIAGHRDIDAGRQPRTEDAVHQADCNKIIPANGRRRLVLVGEELLRSLEASLLGARAGYAPVRPDLEPGMAHRVDIALIAVAPGRGLVGAADHDDAAMAE